MKQREKVPEIVAGKRSSATTILGVVAVAVAIIAIMWPTRPLVDIQVGDTVGRVIKEFEFRFGPEQINLFARNRGGSDAPTLVNVTIVNGYLDSVRDGSFNSSTFVFFVLLTAHSDWWPFEYYIIPAEGAPMIHIEFTVTKSFRFDGSGITNWMFGEYNTYGVNLTYVLTSPGVYKLKA